MIALLLQAAAPSAPPPIPAKPPIGGPIWALVVPALLLVFTAVATWLLYRKFEREEHTK